MKLLIADRSELYLVSYRSPLGSIDTLFRDVFQGLGVMGKLIRPCDLATSPDHTEPQVFPIEKINNGIKMSVLINMLIKFTPLKMYI